MKLASAMNWMLPLLIGLCCTQDSTAQKAEAAADSPVGVWRGDSMCADNASSCKDEKVVYYIEAVTDKPDNMFIRADKIVDGKAITMGSGQWDYNRAKHTLSWQAAQRLWLLTINGKRIEGTLTLPGNVIARRMTLKKDD